MKIKKTQNSKHVRVDTERWLWHIKRILTCAYECFIHWSVLALSLTHHGVVPKMNEYCQKKMRLELISDEKGKKETPTHDIHSHVNHRSILLLADITLLPAFFHSYSRIHSVNKAFSLLRLPLHTFYAFIRSVGSLNRTHTHTLIISINYSILSPWSLFMGFNVLIHI